MSFFSLSLRALRASLRRSSVLRETLDAQFHPAPLPPPVFPTLPLLRPLPAPISCVPPATATTLSLVRHPADSLLPSPLLRCRAALSSPRIPSMACIGDSLLVFRSSVEAVYASRVVRQLQRAARLRPRPTPPGSAKPRVVTRLASSTAVCNAAAGMGLAALVAQEQRDASGPVSLLRLLSSTAGPQKLGIGWIPAPLRIFLANFVLCATLGAAVWLVVLFPATVPWLATGAAVLFAARPDLDSFRMWTRRTAPKVAERKTLLVDKIRAKVAPYVMGLRPPVLDDYALFALVTVVDHADYVYVYAGVLGRWCLLGWYNVADDYNFDKIRAARAE